MKARPYQLQAFEAIKTAIESGDKTPLAVLPTGTGKSLVLALLAKHFADAGQHVLVLAHVGELIAQNEQTYKRICNRPTYVYSASLKRKELGQLTLANVQSFASVRHHRVDLVLIDEAHRVPAKGGQYNAVLDHLRELNPDLVVAGLTATPFREQCGRIDKDIFSPACKDFGTGKFYTKFENHGYLTRLTAAPTGKKLPVARMKIDPKTGDFKRSDLAGLGKDYNITRAILSDAASRSDGRKVRLVFCSSVEQAEDAHAILLANVPGDKVAVVTGKTERKERADIIAKCKAGKLEWLLNVDCLTTGFDAPNIDCLVFLRPTASVGLWVQMLGRGTRPVYAPGYDLTTAQGRLDAIENGGKPDCLVLDYGSNTERLGAINAERTHNDPSGKRKVEPPQKACPKCQTVLPLVARRCTNCGFEFAVKQKEKEFYIAHLELVNRLEPNQFCVIALDGVLHTAKGLQMRPVEPVPDGDYILTNQAGRLELAVI